MCFVSNQSKKAISSFPKKYCSKYLNIWILIDKCSDSSTGGGCVQLDLNPFVHGRFYIYTQTTLNFFKQIFSFKGANLKRTTKFDLLKKSRKKIFIFEYFPKIPSEMNSKHPFYSILIPMTLHAKFLFCSQGGPRGSQIPKFRTKTFIFEYFPKIPSEMNSKHPFYSILIPMTSHAKIFILVVGGPKGVPEP